MTLCLAEPVPASGGFVKGYSWLDFQGVMQLEKMGMAEDATVGFLKRQNLPSCFAGEVDPDQRASLRPETHLRNPDVQGKRVRCKSQMRMGVPPVLALISVSNGGVCFPRSAIFC
jgi:hypothetical protein